MVLFHRKQAKFNRKNIAELEGVGAFIVLEMGFLPYSFWALMLKLEQQQNSNKKHYLCTMSKTTIITGVTIKQQTKKAKEILQNQIIPMENEYVRSYKLGILRVNSFSTAICIFS